MRFNIHVGSCREAVVLAAHQRRCNTKQVIKLKLPAVTAPPGWGLRPLLDLPLARATSGLPL